MGEVDEAAVASVSPEDPGFDSALGDRIASLRLAKDAYLSTLLRSGALAVAGLAISAYTYLRAMFSIGGGAYLIFFGAVVYGTGNAYVASRRYFKTKRALSMLEAQYAPDVVDAAVAAWVEDTLGQDSSAATASAPARGRSAIVSKGYARVIGIFVLIAAAFIVIVPVVMILSSGEQDTMYQTYGLMGAALLAVLDLGVASAVAYVGWRFATQKS